MKRCGRWFLLLWIAARLLYPQAETNPAPAPAAPCELAANRLSALKLAAALNNQETTPPGTASASAAGDLETARSQTAFRLRQSARISALHAFSPAAPALRSETGRRPFGRGPPPAG